LKFIITLLWIFPFLAVGLSGCVVTNNAGKNSGLYLGVVYVSKQNSDKNAMTQMDIKALGTWVNAHAVSNSFGVGWKSSETLTAGSECQIIFIIENINEAEAAVELIKSSTTEGDGICMEKH